MDFSDEELGLTELPFYDANNRLSEAGRLLEDGDLEKAVHELAVALSNTITEATAMIDELNERIAELEAQVATS